MIMFLIVYDIQKDKLRTRFAKFLKQFGRRVQYSVFEITNSPRILANIRTEILANYEKRFGQGDSVLIFDIPDNACVGRFGYPVNEESDLIINK
jgi:CRISPR-associated protein Cas2